VAIISAIIPTVVASAFEAEYAALFLNGQAAEDLRNILHDLGYPQPTTIITADNSTAVGVANRSVKQRRSKTIDMRYHWIRDRADQGHLHIIWGPGALNRADYFTKAHPVHHVRTMRNTFVKDPKNQGKLIHQQTSSKSKPIDQLTSTKTLYSLVVSKGVLEPSAPLNAVIDNNNLTHANHNG
jgi:hypothetical protein